MIRQLELGPHIRQMCFIVEWTVFKLHYGLIIVSEVLQSFQESSERRKTLLLIARVGIRDPPAVTH